MLRKSLIRKKNTIELIFDYENFGKFKKIFSGESMESLEPLLRRMLDDEDRYTRFGCFYIDLECSGGLEDLHQTEISKFLEGKVKDKLTDQTECIAVKVVEYNKKALTPMTPTDLNTTQPSKTEYWFILQKERKWEDSDIDISTSPLVVKPNGIIQESEDDSMHTEFEQKDYHILVTPPKKEKPSPKKDVNRKSPLTTPIFSPSHNLSASNSAPQSPISPIGEIQFGSNTLHQEVKSIREENKLLQAQCRAILKAHTNLSIKYQEVAEGFKILKSQSKQRDGGTSEIDPLILADQNSRIRLLEQEINCIKTSSPRLGVSNDTKRSITPIINQLFHQKESDLMQDLTHRLEEHFRDQLESIESNISTLSRKQLNNSQQSSSQFLDPEILEKVKTIENKSALNESKQTLLEKVLGHQEEKAESLSQRMEGIERLLKASILSQPTSTQRKQFDELFQHMNPAEILQKLKNVQTLVDKYQNYETQLMECKDSLKSRNNNELISRMERFESSLNKMNQRELIDQMVQAKFENIQSEMKTIAKVRNEENLLEVKKLISNIVQKSVESKVQELVSTHETKNSESLEKISTDYATLKKQVALNSKLLKDLKIRNAENVSELHSMQSIRNAEKSLKTSVDDQMGIVRKEIATIHKDIARVKKSINRQSDSLNQLQKTIPSSSDLSKRTRYLKKNKNGIRSSPRRQETDTDEDDDFELRTPPSKKTRQKSDSNKHLQQTIEVLRSKVDSLQGSPRNGHDSLVEIRDEIMKDSPGILDTSTSFAGSMDAVRIIVKELQESSLEPILKQMREFKEKLEVVSPDLFMEKLKSSQHNPLDAVKTKLKTLETDVTEIKSDLTQTNVEMQACQSDITNVKSQNSTMMSFILQDNLMVKNIMSILLPQELEKEHFKYWKPTLSHPNFSFSKKNSILKYESPSSEPEFVTAIGNAVWTSGSHSFTLRLHSFEPDSPLLIGLTTSTQKPDIPLQNHSPAYSLEIHSGKITHKGSWKRYITIPNFTIHPKDMITTIIDFDQRIIRFRVNDQDFGTAFTLPENTQESFSPAISIQDTATVSIEMDIDPEDQWETMSMLSENLMV